MKKPTRFYSKKQEHKVAKDLKGRVAPNSGATAFSKGDVRTDLFLIECKTRTIERESFAIQRPWLDKVKEESFAMNKPYYALAFSFGGNSENYYVIDTKTFKLLNELLESEENYGNQMD